MRENQDQGIVSSLIIFVIVIMLVLAITGCTTPPVIPKFPDAPVKAGAMEQCPDLEKIKDGAKLSDVSKTITINYSTYYECAVKSDTWIEWYQINKINYDKIGK